MNLNIGKSGNAKLQLGIHLISEPSWSSAFVHQGRRNIRKVQVLLWQGVACH